MDVRSMKEYQLLGMRESIADYIDQLEKERDLLRGELEKATGTKEAAGADPKEVVEAWNDMVSSLPKVLKITPTRRKAINARRCEIEEFRKVFELVERSDFLTGRNGKWNNCGFDWVLKPSNWQKILEGTYPADQNKPYKHGAQNIQSDSLTDEMLEALTVYL